MADVAVNFTGKIIGWNLTSKPGHPLESAYLIEWDWDNWIRPQIEFAMALGANAIRLIGDVAMVINAQLSQSTYNARMAQFAAYCHANDLSFYYTGCATYDTDGTDNGNIAAYNAGHAAFADVILSNIAYITGGAGGDYTSRFLGCDLVQEANAWHNSSAVADVYNRVQPSVPSSIPCTFSTSDPRDSSWLSSIIAYCDYIDLHVYPQILGIGGQIDPAWVNTNIRAVYPNKDVLFGEGGVNRNNYTQPERKAWITGLTTLGTMADAKVRGTLCWAVQNQDDPYGAFDSLWLPVSEVVLPWLQGWGGQPTPAAPTNLRIVDNVLYWNPVGCSTLYNSTRLYRNNVTRGTQLHARFDDSQFWPGKQYVYQASVQTTVPSEGPRTDNLIFPGRLAPKQLRRRAERTFR